jgi:hypothetical protein
MLFKKQVRKRSNNMNRLSNRQKLLIKKYTLLILSILLITGIFVSIPSIAKALPRSLAQALTKSRRTLSAKRYPRRTGLLP